MTNSDPIHPGEHLAEFLEELQISQYRLAKVIGTSPRRINEIVHGRPAPSRRPTRAAFRAELAE